MFKQRNTLILSFSAVVVSAFLGNFALAQDKVLSIPLPNKQNSIKKPASDLLKDGKTLDVGEASALAQNGFDLSNLDPVENRMWQKDSYSISDANTRSYPEAQSGVQFTSFEAATKFSSMMRVSSKANPNLSFRLGLSRYSQSVMMRAALLRKLGYFVPSPKYYKNLKISFASEEEKSTFLETAQLDIGVDFESRKWIASDNKADHSIVVASATLEIMSQDYFDIHWGLAPNPDDPGQVSLVQRFSRNRAYRSLIIPYALVDVPESVNRYSVKMANVSSGFVMIPYFMADSFAACTYEDARWILKRVTRLSLEDLKQIVQEAQYPAGISELVLAKLVQRVKSTANYFGLSSSLQNLNLDINAGNGLVVKGKVTKEFTDGYPQRFSHGERTSPYQEGDFARYLGVDLKSSILQNIADKLNKKLEIIGIDDAIAKRQQTIYNRILNHIRTNPQAPLYQEVEAWGGPLAGFNVNGSRHISTGTYSGSTAPVQLVDNMSVAAGIGYFQTLAGIEKYTPLAGANVSAVRDYTHVRPILSIKEGTKEPWKNLLIPKYMKNIAKVLAAEEKTGTDGNVQKTIDLFLTDLRDGEVFTITDSIALSAYLQANAALDVLLGLSPFSYANSITLGADASRVILRQVSFVRIANNSFNGVHVYVRELKNKGVGLELSANFFVNLLKLRAQTTTTDVNTEAFVIEYDAALAAQADPESEFGKKVEKTRKSLRLALLSLLRDNNTELLYSRFANKKFDVKHKLETFEAKQKFLAWKFGSFSEDHLLKIQYPKSEKNPDLNPADETVTLFTSKKGEMKGRDLLSLIFDFVDGIFVHKGKDISVSRAFGDNPANVPVGKAYWRTINTEADLSENIEQYPSVSMIQHVWGGWSLSRDKFFGIIDGIQKQFENTDLVKYPLIDKNEFINVKTLDFYRITANLSILDTGLERIRHLLNVDEKVAETEKPKAMLSKLVAEISNQNSKDPSRKYVRKNTGFATDDELFTELMKLMGNGNAQEGYDNYIRKCTVEKARSAGRRSSGEDYYMGGRYECLSRWMRKMVRLNAKFPSSKKEQTKWLTEVIYLLDQEISLPLIMKYLGEENYVFLVRVNGFRAGDEDGDMEYFSNTVGDPQKDYSYAAGLINLYVKKTGIMPTELDRTTGGYQ